MTTAFTIGRRGFLLASSAALFAAACSKAQAEPITKTTAGQVRGQIVDGTYVFKGIPYGADTATTRFQPAADPAPWEGVRDCLDYGNTAPQVGADRPHVYDSWANPRPESEDCLVLNVYTPGINDGAKRPVMVWFHGGGHTSGSATSKYADGTRLAARNDVVVVGVNHRLNAFGYLYLAHLDPALADSGNVGEMDLVKSLQWVRDNIEAFGGDPGNVLIYGQSGGGGKVSNLLAMPSAEGLFHRAIVQSGSSITGISVDRAKESTKRVMEHLGLTADAAGLAALKAMPQPELSARLQDAGGTFGPVVDGRALPRDPWSPDAPQTAYKVPVMIGTAKDETASLVGGRDESLFSLTWDDLPGRLDGQLGSLDTAHVIEVLRGEYPDAKPSDIFFTATTDARFRRNAILQAERKAAQAAAGGAPAYMYLFAWESPVDGGKWKAPHSIEHAFVFDNVAVSQSMIGEGEDQQKIADFVSSTWAKFARDGNPGWAPYTPEARTTMVINVEPRTVDDPMKTERELFA